VKVVVSGSWKRRLGLDRIIPLQTRDDGENHKHLHQHQQHREEAFSLLRPVTAAAAD